MSKIRLITAHDDASYYGEMALVAKEYAKRQGYSLEITKTTNVKHSKAKLMKDALTEDWVIWMDADSMLFNTIDELFDSEHDLALPILEPVYKKGVLRNIYSKYGAFLWSGFVAVRNTERGRQFLDDWAGCPQETRSDQLDLNNLFEGHIDTSIFGKEGETLNIDGLKIHLLDADIYCSRKAIDNMVLPEEHVKVIHFIGVLQRRWPMYKELLC